ncbi:MAG: AAA family ATPase [Arcobacteraceae bacterium]
MPRITQEHIKDVYKKFKEYFELNNDDFFQRVPKHIVEDIKKIIKDENIFEWNDASLSDYINDLIYMLKGQQFARTINSFAEKYFIEKICQDFDTQLCINAKESLKLHKEYYSNIINKKNDTKLNKDENYNMKTKNIMLYGAPGVGKTHNYKRLITMIENGNDEKTIFDTISKNETTNDFDNSTFETIKKEKRIEFVTFHQSYSYEDFIEGFRPQDNGNIKLEDGIFKKLCSDAEINFLKSSNNKAMLFIDAIGLLLKDKIENQENVKINLKRNNSYYNIYDYNDKTIYFEKQNGDKSHSLSMKTLEKMYYEESNTIINGGLAPYYNPLLEELLKLKKKENVQKEEQKNFYIVIDEINRGNISKIFGELITLIEEDKRDSYEVTLPYSKEKFKIPSNLYIIATMNSTDKSIATIDIALRRRFTFLKMKPNIELVPEIAQKLFTKLNNHITTAINEDYALGHSYFMKIEDSHDLEFVKEYKIKPLLEEYFYGDDENYKKAIDILDLKEDTKDNKND